MIPGFGYAKTYEIINVSEEAADAKDDFYDRADRFKDRKSETVTGPKTIADEDIVAILTEAHLKESSTKKTGTCSSPDNPLSEANTSDEWSPNSRSDVSTVVSSFGKGEALGRHHRKTLVPSLESSHDIIRLTDTPVDVNETASILRSNLPADANGVPVFKGAAEVSWEGSPSKLAYGKPTYLNAGSSKAGVIRGITFLETWVHVVIFVAYIVLYLCYGAWVHETRGVIYSASMMVTAILATKIAVSFGAYILFDGSPRELIQQIKANKRALLLYLFPALAYATTDSLSVYCLRRMDPATFSILYNVRVVFMMVLFQKFLRVQLNRAHWAAIGLVIVGCVVKEVPVLYASQVSGDKILKDLLAERGISAATSSKGFHEHLVTVVILLVMAQLGAFAAVFNEKLLKEQTLSLNVQNLAMYSWALLVTMVFTALIPVRSSQRSFFADLFDPEMWKVVWTYPIVISVLLNAAYGLVTSFFIKTLNNVVREIACGCHVVGTIPINAIYFHRGIHLSDVAAVSFVILGVGVYNRNPLHR